MSDQKQIDKGGRPRASKEEKEEYLRKLKPYLNSGLSVYKACLNAEIPQSTIYDLIREDEKFSDEINRMKTYASVLISNVTMRRVAEITKELQDARNEKRKPNISDDDWNFIKWYSTNHKGCKEEFGRTSDLNINDPQAELQRIFGLLEKNTKKEE